MGHPKTPSKKLVYPRNHPEEYVLTYAVVDDQSNKTLAKSELFDLMSGNVTNDNVTYSLSSCSGIIDMNGRQLDNLIVEAIDGQACLELPSTIECEYIPDIREEISTPSVVEHQPHLQHLVNNIPPLNSEAKILLLIGRDLPEAHHVLEQVIGPKGSPFAQRLPLGWVVVGDVCLGQVHKPSQVNVMKTVVLPNGRPSVFNACRNVFNVKTCDSDFLGSADFYVDDALTSIETANEGISLLRRTQTVLQTEGHLRLHKIASNSKQVMAAFPQEDLAKDLKKLDNLSDYLPVQHSLGLSWDLNSDSFLFKIQESQLQKPFTRRGLLSTINSIFDPLGFLAPITVQGKILLRELSTDGYDWDQVLPSDRKGEWNSWKDFLQAVEEMKIPRAFISYSLKEAVSCDLHIYSDASEKVIASVAYMKCVDSNGKTDYGFIIGKAKVAPFSSVGVDTFGPWSVVTRKTRGGQANSKRWAVLFSCLTTRAVHIELVEEMSSSSFINALRRFIALRGKVKIFRSDRGTNFIGAASELKINAINVEDGPVKRYLDDSKCTWIFNSPHSSHMGGAWERMIGLSRRILDSTLSSVSSRKLTHEVLVTLMAEVCAILNARPITPVSSDPENPSVLSPSMLLTQKCYHAVDDALTDFSLPDMYRAQWKMVQYLANNFWNRWRKEYLHLLQSRHKWHDKKPNLKCGDIVLLRDKLLNRNDWPIGRVMKTIPDDDGMVRKLQLRVMKNNKVHILTRPVSETVLLIG